MTRQIRDPRARERIIETAWAVVADQGVDGATVRTIAGAAGVSTGFITHYFEDKHELIAAVLQHNNTRAQRRVLRAASAGPALARLRAAVDAVLPLDVARRREWQVWVACWGRTSPGEELADGLTTGWGGLRALLSALLEQAIDEGDLPHETDAAYEAERLVTTLAGIGLLAGVSTPGQVRAQARRMVDDQLRGLGAAAAA